MKIDNKLKELCMTTMLGVIYFSARVEESNDALKNELQTTIDMLRGRYQLEDIANRKHIKTTRKAYLAFKKSPSEYRNASEAMLRRIVKGKGLYYINNIVEINNIVSILSGYSIGTYDLEKLKGDITLKIALPCEKYEGIGKDFINIENLPTLYDEIGSFGNPTSDSKRAMVKLGNRNLMMVIYSFDGDSELEDTINMVTSLLKKYAEVDIKKTEIIQ